MISVYHTLNPRFFCTHEAAYDGYNEQMVRPNIVRDGRRPKPKHWEEYKHKHWNREVNRELADQWDQRLIHCIMRGPTGFEVWCYESGKAPRKGSAWEHQAARYGWENGI